MLGHEQKTIVVMLMRKLIMTPEIISHELNFQALSVLQNSLSKKLYQRTMLSEASKGVWDVLDRMHE